MVFNFLHNSSKRQEFPIIDYYYFTSYVFLLSLIHIFKIALVLFIFLISFIYIYIYHDMKYFLSVKFSFQTMKLVTFFTILPITCFIVTHFFHKDYVNSSPQHRPYFRIFSWESKFNDSPCKQYRNNNFFEAPAVYDKNLLFKHMVPIL